MTANIDQLIVRLGDTVVQTVALTLPVLTIGRSTGSTITLPHRSVSRRHAEIRVEGDRMVIVDLGSANGIIVDGERLPAHQVRPLRPGAVVQIGPYSLIFHAQTGAEMAGVHILDDATVLEVHHDLHIEIDPRQRQKQVSEITESEYFQRLRDAKRRLQSKE